MEDNRTVQLGFLEKPEDPARLSDFEYLPDKVGGKPVRNFTSGLTRFKKSRFPKFFVII
jgi:hypothetical protein